MKLSVWARQQGISYLTAYRWFKDNKLPVEAYQSESGTIIVKEPSSPNNDQSNDSADSMSLFLKKTVEFSKNNSTVEDFAAYVLSNFKLQSNENPIIENKINLEELQTSLNDFSSTIATNQFANLVSYSNSTNYTNAILDPLTFQSTSVMAFHPSQEDIDNAHKAAEKLVNDIRETVKPKKTKRTSKKVEKK